MTENIMQEIFGIKSAVAYYRASTHKQGINGYGIQAQQKTVTSFAKRNGYLIKAEFTEVASGKKDNRKVLMEAIAFCDSNNATLLVSSIDRLSRNAAFTMKLADRGVDFVAAETPDISKLVINKMALVAQQEREAIASRTKAALAARKERGLAWSGKANLDDEKRALGREANRAKFLVTDKKEGNYIRLLRDNGLTYQAIADRLNSEGKVNSKGNPFTITQVKNILDRQKAAI